jgi:hypothetical protein
MMKKLALALVAAAILGTATTAHAVEKLLGTITQIAAKDGGAVATLKDAKSGQLVEITVKDKVTLDKFNDKRISVGDEIKCKYEKKDGKNEATYFKKAGGC